MLVAFCTIGGICVFIGRYPWASLSILVLMLFLGSVAIEDRYGVWPWQMLSRSNPEYDLEDEDELERGLSEA